MIYHSKKNDNESIYDLQKEIPIFEEIYLNYRNLFQTKSIISYSGGKDSSLLIYLYFYLSKKKNIPKPILFHLDHSIRDNKYQENLIREFMNSLSSKIYFLKKNIPKLSFKLKKSMEETGRIYRYHELRKIAKKENALIITGHHSTDYMESILINLIRGGGANALKTLPFYTGEIFRPLLFISPTQRKQLIEEISIPVFEDETNESEVYLRNRIRKSVVPVLEEEGINFQKLYFNFHDKEIEVFSTPKKKQSYYSINDSGLLYLSPSQLKQILDIYLTLLSYHPIKKKILLEIYNTLQKNNVVHQENSEVIFWKSPTSNLSIIDKNSQLFINSIIKDGKIIWNNKEKTINLNYEIIKNFDGMKIIKNNQKKDISEIMRNANIPVPIRNYLPIIGEKHSAKVILFSLWDDKIKDFYGD